MIENGWTVLTPSTDSRLVYVSQSEGNDTNDGLSELTPKKTFAAANLLIRPGYPDWLLLKCGDVWDEDLNYKGRGPSDEVRSVITSYKAENGNDVRPMIRNRRLKNNEPQAGRVNIVGIECYASFNDPNSPDFGLGTPTEVAIQNMSPAQESILIEDCAIRFYSTACHLRCTSGHNTNIVFRRNIISDCLKFGVMPSHLSGGLIEENIFDKCGWEERTNKLHSIYAHSCINNTIWRNNILSRSGNFGIKLSTDDKNGFTDFEISNNFFYKSSIGIDHSAGATGYDPLVDYSHQRGVISNNVFYKTGKTITPTGTSTATFGIYTLNTNDMVYSDNCFIFNDDYYGSGSIIAFGEDERHGNVTVANERIYKWNSGKYDNFGSYLNNVQTIRNLVQTNSYLQCPSEIQFLDPERGLASYSVYLGGTDDNEAFLTRAKQQSKGNWDDNYTAAAFNDYIRIGLVPIDFIRDKILLIIKAKTLIIVCLPQHLKRCIGKVVQVDNF